MRTYIGACPGNGFVGSGAVELYLAGVRRSAEPGAEFAVHSWEDDTGREPADYGADAAPNRAYLDYYQAMGMSEGEARAFYAMTNSVPFAAAKWLTASEMDRWAGFDGAGRAPAALRWSGRRGGGSWRSRMKSRTRLLVPMLLLVLSAGAGSAAAQTVIKLCRPCIVLYQSCLASGQPESDAPR